MSFACHQSFQLFGFQLSPQAAVTDDISGTENKRKNIFRLCRILSLSMMEMEIVVSLVIFLVGVAVLAMIHLCVVARVFRNGFENSEDKIPRRISREDLNSLPCFDYIAPQGEDSISGDCAVCLEMFSEGDKCRFLPNCNHSFHVQCIDLWLLKTSLCPICRTRVSQTLSQQTSISVSVAVELT